MSRSKLTVDFDAFAPGWCPGALMRPYEYSTWNVVLKSPGIITDTPKIASSGSRYLAFYSHYQGGRQPGSPQENLTIQFDYPSSIWRVGLTAGTIWSPAVDQDVIIGRLDAYGYSNQLLASETKEIERNACSTQFEVISSTPIWKILLATTRIRLDAGWVYQDGYQVIDDLEVECMRGLRPGSWLRGPPIPPPPLPPKRKGPQGPPSPRPDMHGGAGSDQGWSRSGLAEPPPFAPPRAPESPDITSAINALAASEFVRGLKDQKLAREIRHATLQYARVTAERLGNELRVGSDSARKSGTKRRRRRSRAAK